MDPRTNLPAVRERGGPSDLPPRPASDLPPRPASDLPPRPASDLPPRPASDLPPRPASDRPPCKADLVPQYDVPLAKPEVSLDDPSLYFNRELSWLEFNRRVLELAEDESVPLLER